MAFNPPNPPEDAIPIIGGRPDGSPLGRFAAKPPHERTADEERHAVNWEGLAASESFRRLIKAKWRFIMPAMIFFIAYYFALPILVGYARPLMETRVFGAVNIAYLFALSQFFMAWIIAARYVRAAAQFDRMAREVIEQDRT